MVKEAASSITRIIGFNGAYEDDGTVARLLGASILEAKKTIEQSGHEARTEIVQLCKVVTTHFKSEDENLPKSVRRVIDKMRVADGFIFASPVHWFNISSPMKSFLDWLAIEEEAPEFPLRGKVAGVLVHCREDGGNQAAMSIIAPLLHMGMLIPPFSAFFRNKYGSKMSELKWQQKDHLLVARNVVRLVECIRKQKQWQ